MVPSAYLVGAVEEGEDVSLLHRHLARTLLRVVVQRHHTLLADVVHHRSLLLLQTLATHVYRAVCVNGEDNKSEFYRFISMTRVLLGPTDNVEEINTFVIIL